VLLLPPLVSLFKSTCEPFLWPCSRKLTVDSAVDTEEAIGSEDMEDFLYLRVTVFLPRRSPSMRVQAAMNCRAPMQ
jgi:hypothetical protein